MHSIPTEERDPEAVIMDAVMHYMNSVGERSRVRLMFHLQHKYFPDGDFVPRITQPIRLSPRGSGPAPMPPAGPFAPPPSDQLPAGPEKK